MSLVYVSPTPVHSPCAAAMILHETLLDVMPIRCIASEEIHLLAGHEIANGETHSGPMAFREQIRVPRTAYKRNEG